MSTPVSKPVRLSQLAAEVAAAHGWTKPAALSLSVDESGVGALVVHTDGADSSKVQAAVDAHTPTAEPDPVGEFQKVVKAATTLDALKAALLGTTGPGAEPRNR